MIISKQILNRSHDILSPSLNLFVVIKGSDFSPFTLTSDLDPAKVSLHIYIHNICRNFHNEKLVSSYAVICLFKIYKKDYVYQH